MQITVNRVTVVENLVLLLMQLDISVVLLVCVRVCVSIVLYSCLQVTRFLWLRVVILTDVPWLPNRSRQKLFRVCLSLRVYLRKGLLAVRTICRLMMICPLRPLNVSVLRHGLSMDVPVRPVRRISGLLLLSLRRRISV